MCSNNNSNKNNSFFATSLYSSIETKLQYNLHLLIIVSKSIQKSVVLHTVMGPFKTRLIEINILRWDNSSPKTVPVKIEEIIDVCVLFLAHKTVNCFL